MRLDSLAWRRFNRRLDDLWRKASSERTARACRSTTLASRDRQPTMAYGKRRSVSKVQPDLVLIAYGMNDAGYASAADFTGRIQKIMSQIRGGAPAAEFVLVAPMLPHPEWDYVIEGGILEYRDGLARLCDDGVVIADVTSLWSALLARKSQHDLSGNGINHPNDFGHRCTHRRSWACWSKHSVTSRTCQVWKVMAFFDQEARMARRVAHVCRALAGASSLILAISSGTAAQTVERAAEVPTLTEGPTVDREGNLLFTEPAVPANLQSGHQRRADGLPREQPRCERSRDRFGEPSDCVRRRRGRSAAANHANRLAHRRDRSARRQLSGRAAQGHERRDDRQRGAGVLHRAGGARGLPDRRVQDRWRAYSPRPTSSARTAFRSRQTTRSCM